MIIDIIVILKVYLIFNFIDNGGVRIRYPFPNTETLCYNTDSVRRKTYIPLNKLYSESIRQITITLFIINFMNNYNLF